jgi:hypothetical protein
VSFAIFAGNRGTPGNRASGGPLQRPRNIREHGLFHVGYSRTAEAEKAAFVGGFGDAPSDAEQPLLEFGTFLGRRLARQNGAHFLELRWDGSEG